MSSNPVRFGSAVPPNVRLRLTRVYHTQPKRALAEYRLRHDQSRSGGGHGAAESAGAGGGISVAITGRRDAGRARAGRPHAMTNGTCYGRLYQRPWRTMRSQELPAAAVSR